MGCGASNQTSALEASPPDGQTAVEEDLSESGETASIGQSSLSYDLHPPIKGKSLMQLTEKPLKFTKPLMINS